MTLIAWRARLQLHRKNQRLERSLQQGTATRTSQASISAALAVATASAASRVPSQSGAASLAEIAQRDLDAALQLLADRAQYITGSSGAAIALRRNGKNDMLCRASAGSNAPELGALLSTEFGLSGESVRLRQLLRCDDVERDLRVNREACRQLGIASVVVMPVVNDDEVLGVFELFSGKVNAFAERDLTALKRLSEMVETAVKLARAAEQIPEQLLESSPGAEAAQTLRVGSVPENDDAILEVEGEFVADAVLADEAHVSEPSDPDPSPEIATQSQIDALLSPDPPTVKADTEKLAAPEAVATPHNRPLLWSIALDPVPGPGTAQSGLGRVPATLRDLGKCQACGFPISPGRALCVECEEKKWRGQLRPSLTTKPSAGASAAAAAPAPAQEPATAAVSKDSKPSFQPAKEVAKPAKPLTETTAIANAVREPRAEASPSRQTSTSEPELVLTAAMEPSQSWISAHKFIILVLLAAGAGAAVLLLR